MFRKHLKIIQYSRHFSVTRLTDKGKHICLSFCKKLVQYGYMPQKGKMIKVPVKVFASASEKRDAFRFHINNLKDFLNHINLNNCKIDEYEHEIEDEYDAQEVELPIKPMWVLRDYQEPIVDWLALDEPRNKLLGLMTGQGKTVSALSAISRIGLRFAVIIKPAYTDKWVDDIIKTYDIDKDDILVIAGGASLMTLLMLAKEDKVTAKAIIISNTTFSNWIKLYEKFQEDTLDMGYACYPYEFFGFLKIGVRLIDELHQHYFGCFKTDLYTHVKYTIALSATMVTDDPFIDKMHTLAYPQSDRYKDSGLIKYINSYAVHFRFDKPEHIRTNEYGSNNYSHNAFERSVIKYVPTLTRYLNLIDYTIQIGYLKVKREKKRLLIFAYCIDLIDKIVEFLHNKYSEFDVRRYVAEDDYSNLMEADICVSTLGSSGTAVDIPDLTNVILTTNINSIQSNIQSLGRLRQLSDNHPVEFMYFVCDDIPKSVEYHISKKEMLLKRARTFSDIYSGRII